MARSKAMAASIAASVVPSSWASVGTAAVAGRASSTPAATGSSSLPYQSTWPSSVPLSPLCKELVRTQATLCRPQLEQQVQLLEEEQPPGQEPARELERVRHQEA